LLPTGDDARALHRDRLRDLEGVVDGDDLSVSKNEVRGAGLLRVQRQRQSDDSTE
jgi:hypothetical protein